MANYFVMESKARHPIADVSLITKDIGSPWMTGSPVADPEVEIVYSVNPERPGNLCALYWELGVPAIRHDLLKVLQDSGVDNLQTFAAVLRDRKANIEHNNYSAMNIVGLVEAADIAKSELMHDESLTGMDRDFRKLVIDNERVPSNLLMFRLAESVNAMVVHEGVRKAIEQANIAGMVFYEPGEWSG